MSDVTTSDLLTMMAGNGNNENWWIILLILLLGGGGGLYGNAARGVQDQYVLASDFATLQRQIDSATQSLERKGDSITNGLCDGFFTTNMNIKDGMYTTQRDILTSANGLNQSINDNRFMTEKTATEIKGVIAESRYAADKNACEIKNAIHAEGEATRALITAQETQRLRDENCQLRDKLSNSAQTADILGVMGRWYSNPPWQPQCGCNTGCCGNY